MPHKAKSVIAVKSIAVSEDLTIEPGAGGEVVESSVLGAPKRVRFCLKTDAGERSVVVDVGGGTSPDRVGSKPPGVESGFDGRTSLGDDNIGCGIMFFADRFGEIGAAVQHTRTIVGGIGRRQLARSHQPMK
jgi:hypothetical protein